MLTYQRLRDVQAAMMARLEQRRADHEMWWGYAADRVVALAHEMYTQRKFLNKRRAEVWRAFNYCHSRRSRKRQGGG
jgi:hypothetical protein